jgi:hypothetical protein
MATEAGKGEQHIYKIVPPAGSDQAKLTAGCHYVSIDAVSWFINKQALWFSERIASGTLDIKMSAGAENYPVALGVFNPPAGARTARVFEKPILADRNYRGGPLSISAVFSSVKRDAASIATLKSAASASLSVVEGMIETAAISGPAGILAAAGREITGAVLKFLADPILKRDAFLDFSGMDFYLRPEAMVGPEIFVLFHRGAELKEAGLSVKTGVDRDKPGLTSKRLSDTLIPYYESAPLEDGAWLMIRIRRSDEYSGMRAWYTDAARLRNRVKSLVDDVKAGSIAKDDGLAQLKPSGTGDQTVLDEFFRLRPIIYNDGVLSEREAGAQVGLLYTAIMAAKDAIKKVNPELLTSAFSRVSASLSKGKSVDGEIGEAFAEQVALVANVRKSFIARDTSPSRIAKLTGEELFSTMQYLPKTLERCTLR